jgi:hypothetical protein
LGSVPFGAQTRDLPLSQNFTNVLMFLAQNTITPQPRHPVNPNNLSTLSWHMGSSKNTIHAIRKKMGRIDTMIVFSVLRLPKHFRTLF